MTKVIWKSLVLNAFHMVCLDYFYKKKTSFSLIFAWYCIVSHHQCHFLITCCMLFTPNWKPMRTTNSFNCFAFRCLSAFIFSFVPFSVLHYITYWWPVSLWSNIHCWLWEFQEPEDRPTFAQLFRELIELMERDYVQWCEIINIIVIILCFSENHCRLFAVYPAVSVVQTPIVLSFHCVWPACAMRGKFVIVVFNLKKC